MLKRRSRNELIASNKGLRDFFFVLIGRWGAKNESPLFSRAKSVLSREFSPLLIGGLSIDRYSRARV